MDSRSYRLCLRVMASLSLRSFGRHHALRHRITSSQPFISNRRAFTSSSSRSRLQNVCYTTIFVLSAGLFTAYYLDSRSAIHRYLLTPVLRYAFDAETGQKIALKVLRSGLAPRDIVVDEAVLRSEVKHLLCV